MSKSKSMACFFCLLFLWYVADPVPACQCSWEGPFLKASCRSPLVVYARIVQFSEKTRDTSPFMDIDVIEPFSGGMTDKRLRVWGDPGMLCRADLRQFPVDSEWILALDGPGSKPAMSPGHALSLCGQYWLGLAGDKVIGLIDDAAENIGPQEMPLQEFRKRFHGKSCRDSIRFSGEISTGASFLRYFGNRFTFHLKPIPAGWMLSITDERGTEDISRFTPPWHFVPNPRELEGWHFRNADNTGPNEAGEKNVNAPGNVREFFFSPEVGRTIGGPAATDHPTEEEMERIRQYGTGILTILDYRLTNLEPNQQARFEWMRFQVEMTWPQKEGS